MTGTGPVGEPAPGVRVVLDGPVLRIVMDDPATGNALTVATVRGIRDAVRAAETAPAVRVVVLSGAAGTFSSGWHRHDPDLEPNSDARSEAARRALGEAYLAIAGCPLPVLARVQGWAFGAAVGLVGASDLAVSTNEAVFCLPEPRFGLVANPAMVPCLARWRPADAARFLLTGERFTGVQAAEAGLVSRSVAADALDPTVDELVNGVLAGAPDAVAATKRLLGELAVSQLRARLDVAAGLVGR